MPDMGREVKSWHLKERHSLTTAASRPVSETRRDRANAPGAQPSRLRKAVLKALAESYPISSATRSRDIPPRLKASWAKLMRQRDRYSIGAQPITVAKRVAKAERDMPACFANSLTDHPRRTSACMARSASARGASRMPASSPADTDSSPMLRQRRDSTSMTSTSRSRIISRPDLSAAYSSMIRSMMRARRLVSDSVARM